MLCLVWWWRVARPRDTLCDRDSGAQRAIATAYLILHAMSWIRAAMAWESWVDCLRKLNLPPIPDELEVTAEETARFASSLTASR